MSNPDSASSPTEVPLCVDLDGTLVRTDTLHESLVSFLKTAPWQAPFVPLWLMRGRAYVKQKLAEHSHVNASLLPYQKPVLEAISQARAQGRKVFLVTAADKHMAQAVANHLGVFDEVMASDGGANLKGETKAEALVGRFGEKGFDYIGNSSADLPIWKHSRQALVINASSATEAQAKAVAPTTILGPGTPILRPLLKELRPYQWVKNVLVFVPLVAGHSFWAADTWLKAFVMFFAWCAMASCIYVLNDLLDLEADRRHPRKSRRPLASGALPLSVGLLTAPMLALAALVLAALLNASCVGIVLAYGATSLAYSVFLKKHAIVDAFILTSLYTMRVVGGGLAITDMPTAWLLAFSCFLFLGLAFLKRCAELTGMEASDMQLMRRGYRAEDLPVIRVFGIVSGFLSALVLGLYVSTIARKYYASPPLLWAMVPPILLWQCRLWLATGRGEMEDDPIVYSAKDWVSWMLGLAVALAFFAALKTNLWKDDPFAQDLRFDQSVPAAPVKPGN